MDASPSQLRALLVVIAGSLAVVVAVIARLARSGRVVRFPDLTGGPHGSSPEERGPRGEEDRATAR